MTSQTGRRILVVDDSATMRMYISMTIIKFASGISITEAVNGADALEKMRDQEFDLVLTDMMMPVMDGAGLIDGIRRSLNRTTPIIIITTRGEERERNAGLSSGANGYITKPLKVHELREAVSKFLP